MATKGGRSVSLFAEKDPNTSAHVPWFKQCGQDISFCFKKIVRDVPPIDPTHKEHSCCFAQNIEEGQIDQDHRRTADRPFIMRYVFQVR